MDPKPKFVNPRKNQKTRDPTRTKSKNPKPDPRGKKLTRPIPINYLLYAYLFSSYLMSLLTLYHCMMEYVMKLKLLDVQIQKHVIMIKLPQMIIAHVFTQMRIDQVARGSHQPKD